MLTSCFLGIKSALFLERLKGWWGGGEGAETCEEGTLCYRPAKKETDRELQRTRNEGIVVGSFLNLN